MSAKFIALAAAGATTASILLLTGITPAQAADDGWTLYGSAAGTFSNGGSVVLTEDQLNQAGIVLQNTVTSLAKPVTFRYRLEHTGDALAADGSSFFMLNEGAPLPQEPLPVGGQLGIGGLSGLAVVFDTWRNEDPAGDPAGNYIGIVDMSKGLWGKWLVTKPDDVMRDAIRLNAPMDVAITVDRAQFAIQVGITYPRSSGLPSSATHVFRLPASVFTPGPNGTAPLSGNVRIGFSAATGTTSGGHQILRYNGRRTASPITSAGLWGVAQKLTQAPSIRPCADVTGRSANRPQDTKAGSRRTPRETSNGGPVNTLQQSTEERRTAFLFVAGCIRPQTQDPWLGRCSGVLVSAELLLTAEHCVRYEEPEESGAFYPAEAYRVVVGAVRLPATVTRTTRSVSSGGECDAHVIWRGRGPAEFGVSNDLALLRLSSCTQAERLRRLGGAPMDTTFAFAPDNEPPTSLRYVGYPGDRPTPGQLPPGASASYFPEMWRHIALAKPEMYQGAEVIELAFQVAGGGSGGPFFTVPATAGSQSAVVSVASRSGGAPLPNFTMGSYISRQSCASMWAAAALASAAAPTCLGAPEAPAVPTGVLAQAQRRSVQVAWQSIPGVATGSVIYTVSANIGAKSCTTTSSTCAVTGLDPNKRYTFTVRATGPYGSSAPSKPTSLVAPGR